MSDVDRAFETQLQNIQAKTGKTLAQLTALVQKSGLSKHREIRDMLKRELDLGYGDANTLAHFARKADVEGKPPKEASNEEVVGNLYSGAKAELRPIHEKLMAAITKFGSFEIAPKKTYVSLRRNKQFAMVGPATNTRVEVGLNMKRVKATSRLQAMPAGGMCQYKVKLTDPTEVDKELIGWIRQAYDSVS